MSLTRQNSKPMEPEYHVRTWLCNQTGILPSQYTSLAIEKVRYGDTFETQPHLC